MEARDRKLTVWHGKIQRGEIKLPRFQRFEAWDRTRICSLLDMVIQDLPLGITLILEVGDPEKFISRYLETAPANNGPVYEHLLDGQQRLTALWRAFHNNYEFETYFIYLKEFDRYEKHEDFEDMTAYWRGRYFKKTGERYPLWCDDPEQSLRRGMIPTSLLKPEDIQNEIDDWIGRATEPLEPDGNREELKRFYDFKKRVSDQIKDLRSIVSNYNLPFLSLPAQTEKSVALTVFINMNTNTKPLSTYDMFVAEVEEVTGQSLHDMEDELAKHHPEVERYANLSDLILTTSSLLQGQLPNQRGACNMSTQALIENWKTIKLGLKRLANFLKGEGIYDERRLPTNAVYAKDREGEQKYSPPEVIETVTKVMIGNPEPHRICTSIVERSNLSIRTSVRRLTRLTNAFSKKWEHLRAMLALYFAYYNFCRIHSSIRCTPAMESGITSHVWELRDLVCAGY